MGSYEVRDNPATITIPVVAGQADSLNLLPSVAPAAGIRVRNRTGEKAYWASGGSVSPTLNHGTLNVEEAPQVIDLASDAWNISFYSEGTGFLDVEISPEPFSPFSDWQRTVKWINPEPLIDITETDSRIDTDVVNVEQWNGLHVQLQVGSSANTFEGFITFVWVGSQEVNPPLIGSRTFKLFADSRSIEEFMNLWEWKLPNLGPFLFISVLFVQAPDDPWTLRAFSVNGDIPSIQSTGNISKDGERFIDEGIHGATLVNAATTVFPPDNIFSGYAGPATFAATMLTATDATIRASLLADGADICSLWLNGSRPEHTGKSEIVYLPPQIISVRLQNLHATVNRTIDWSVIPLYF